MLLREAVEVLVKVDAAAGAEVGDQLAGLGVECVDVAAEAGEEAPVRAIGPVGEATGTLAGGFGIPGPDEAAGGAVERDEFAAGRVAVDQAIDDEGVGFEAAAAIGTIVGPGNLELGDIGAIDLFEGRVARVLGVAAIGGPFPAFRVGGGLRQCDGGGQGRSQGQVTQNSHCDLRFSETRPRCKKANGRRKRLPHLPRLALTLLLCDSQ